MRYRPAAQEKPLYWVGSAKRDLLGFPPPVVSEIGWALGVAQFGSRHPASKPWKGAGPRVFEIAERHGGDAFRAVYTVQFEGAVYVLHCFQKKSPRGVKTARADVAAVRRRLTMARRDYEERHGKKAKQETGRGTQLR
jgi:phage-related protein